MNYTELAAAVRSYAENDFPDTVGTGGMTSDEQVAMFVREAEQRIYNSVQLLVERFRTTLTCTPSDPYLAYPADWLAGISLAAVAPSNGDYYFLLNKDVEFIREAYPNPANTARPQYYAYDDSSQFILGPTPDTAYSMELVYYKYPTSIVDAGTSWLGDNMDSVLLYGALLEAAAFMKSEEDTVKTYQQRYDEALVQLKMLAEGKDRQDTYRTPQARYPVK